MSTSLSSRYNWKEDVFPPEMQILYYSVAHRKRLGLLYPITWLFLVWFLISWHVLYRAWKMQATATNRITIGLFVLQLWHFKDQWLNLEWENGNGCCRPGNFSLRLAFAKDYGHKLLHKWSGPLNLIVNCWRPIPILILFYSHFLPFHFIPIPFHFPF